MILVQANNIIVIQGDHAPIVGLSAWMYAYWIWSNGDMSRHIVLNNLIAGHFYYQPTYLCSI